MGGAWEALIKSVTRTLKAMACDCLFTEEALHTFICEAESILNNQPFTPSSNNINDYEALTPNHILLGHSSSNHVIQTDNIPRSHWPLGLIIETYCAVDGVERTVKVKTPLLEKANKQQLISYQNIAWNLPHWGGCHNRNIYVILVLFNCVSCTLVLVVHVIHT